MSLLTNQPLSEAAQKILERVKDMFGEQDVPPFFETMGCVEAFLKDFYMNFKKFVYSEGKLTLAQKSAIALATASHAKNKDLMDYFAGFAKQQGHSDQVLLEILAIASTNYMYNTFFKFKDLSGTDRFDGMGVGLRAHTFAGTSLDDSMVELINLAISDLNACEPCTSGHVLKADKLGLSHEQMLEAIQCAATVYAGAQFLNAIQ